MSCTKYYVVRSYVKIILIVRNNVKIIVIIRSDLQIITRNYVKIILNFTYSQNQYKDIFLIAKSYAKKRSFIY